MNKSAVELSQELRGLQSLPLDKKVQISRELILKGLEKGKTAVMWSGGKDSTVLLDMVRQFQPDITVVWNNTGVEFPETWQFVEKMRDEWKLNLHISSPELGKTFWWCVEQYGWPLLGKDIRQSAKSHFKRRLSKRREKASLVARISSYCCDYLKIKPTDKICRELGIEIEILGNMVSESRMRWFTWLDKTEIYLQKQTKRWKVTPLYFWRDEDIWEYHEVFTIPHCTLYNMGHKRNGCWPCMMNIAFPDNNLLLLRQSHPKLWRFLMLDKGLGKELLKIKLALRDNQIDFFQSEKIEAILEQRPCYFDSLFKV